MLSLTAGDVRLDRQQTSPTDPQPAPTDQNAAPTHQCRSPTHQAASPTSKSFAPTGKMTNPTRQQPSQADQAASPTHQRASQAEKCLSTAEKVGMKTEIRHIEARRIVFRHTKQHGHSGKSFSATNKWTCRSVSTPTYRKNRVSERKSHLFRARHSVESGRRALRSVTQNQRLRRAPLGAIAAWHFNQSQRFRFVGVWTKP